MTTDFNSSKTRKACAPSRESQARNRYTFAASCAKKNGLAVVEINLPLHCQPGRRTCGNFLQSSFLPCGNLHHH